MGIFSDAAITGLKKGLDAAGLRHRVMADNIANVNTPRFKKSTVVFESLLQKALDEAPVRMAVADYRHFGGGTDLAGVRPVVMRSKATSMRTDGNNVDIDQEMAALAVNTIRYRALSTDLREHYALLSLAITGRG